MTEMPAPGKVTLEVEAYSKTMSGFPASRQRERMSGTTGGYFVSLDTADGLAKRTLALCKEAGVGMTSAGEKGVD